MDKVEVKGLTKKYPGVLALDNVSFSIESGCVTGFLGPNGAGKSTAMKIMAGIISPTSGTADICGYDLRTHLNKIKQITGYMPENNPLYNEMRVKEFLRFRARIKGLGGKLVKQRVDEVINKCFIAEFQNKVIKNLSKGMRQRVGIADAIIHDPKFLIFDEPTIGLDPNQLREVRNLLVSLAKDKIIFLSTHILSEVESICQNIIVIHRGEIVSYGLTKDLATSLKMSNRLRVQVQGNGRGLKKEIESIDGVKSIIFNERDDISNLFVELNTEKDIRGDIYDKCKKTDLRLLELTFESLSLEEAFSKLTK